MTFLSLCLYMDTVRVIAVFLRSFQSSDLDGTTQFNRPGKSLCLFP